MKFGQFLKNLFFSKFWIKVASLALAFVVVILLTIG